MADAASALTIGCLANAAHGQLMDAPIVQCVQIKPMASAQGNERFRVVMNDSVNFIQGMLGQRKWSQDHVFISVS